MVKPYDPKVFSLYKYPVPIKDNFTLAIPAGAKILCVNEQHGEGFMWILVDKDATPENRTFRLAGTGHPIGGDEVDSLEYIGSYRLNQGCIVFHLFEVVG